MVGEMPIDVEVMSFNLNRLRRGLAGMLRRRTLGAGHDWGQKRLETALDLLGFDDRRRSAFHWEPSNDVKKIAKSTEINFSFGTDRTTAQKFNQIEKLGMGCEARSAFPTLGVESIGRRREEKQRRRALTVVPAEQFQRQRVICAGVKEFPITLKLIEDYEIWGSCLKGSLS